MHSVAELSGMSLGNARDQVSGARKGHRSCKAADNRDDIARQPERLQCFIDRPFVGDTPRDVDVPPGCVTGGRDVDLAQRMSHSHDANHAIAEQGLRSHLRASIIIHDAGLDIHGPIAKGFAVLVWLLHETQLHAGSFLANEGNEVWSKILHETFACSQCEASDQLFEIKHLSRA